MRHALGRWFPVLVGLCLASACIGVCQAEDYLLVIEEVEGIEPETDDGLPPATIPAALPPTVGGWIELNKEFLSRMNAVKTIELLVSTAAPFHLRIDEHGSVMQIEGRLRTADMPSEPDQKPAPAAAPQKAEKSVSPPPKSQIVIDVEVKRAREPGSNSQMNLSLPVESGKRYRSPPGFRESTTTVWSLRKLKAD